MLLGIPGLLDGSLETSPADLPVSKPARRQPADPENRGIATASRDRRETGPSQRPAGRLRSGAHLPGHGTAPAATGVVHRRRRLPPPLPGGQGLAEAVVPGIQGIPERAHPGRDRCAAGAGEHASGVAPAAGRCLLAPGREDPPGAGHLRLARLQDAPGCRAPVIVIVIVIVLLLEAGTGPGERRERRSVGIPEGGRAAVGILFGGRRR